MANKQTAQKFPPYHHTDGGTHSGFNVRDARGFTMGIAHDEIDAKLFAAAPELLDALEKTLAYARAMEKRLGVADAANVTLEPARAAIAKARGQ